MRFALALVLLTAGVPALATPLVFSEHGFSIEPLKGHAGDKVQQVVAMQLPPTGGFAPNVNVQVQPFAGSFDDYLKISHDEFARLGIVVKSEKRAGKSATALEYTGSLQGQPLHWYARAVLAAGKVYLVTATATESQWPEVAAQLRLTVDSFKLAQ